MAEQCYFCEGKNATENIYITEMIDGKVMPVQVAVCKDCKAEYETTFPKY